MGELAKRCGFAVAVGVGMAVCVVDFVFILLAMENFLPGKVCLSYLPAPGGINIISYIRYIISHFQFFSYGTHPANSQRCRARHTATAYRPTAKTPKRRN